VKQTVIGLSGHIDHGKTALVKALTGVNTDKLKEEKKRGMTIDIGFAFLDEEITLIDVPGHEKFVKNMVSGVSSVDVALLVIAADDGVMPQTREHFEILKLLEVPLGLVIINKVDLVDKDWLDLVELDVSDLIKGSFMENSSILKVSAETGEGIENLKSEIIKICSDVPKRYDRGIFRMHIDRVFSKKGHGTVVTGTVNSGKLVLGQIIEILPGYLKSKVRGLQSHSKDVVKVVMGDRAAINLQGTIKSDLSRGSQIADLGYLKSVKQIGVALKLLNSAKNPIVQNQRIRVHLGTQEVIARIALTKGKVLNQGDSVSALLRLENPIIAAYGDKFIIRTFSPVMTIGGGKVIETLIEDRWKDIKCKLEDYFNSNSLEQFIKMVEYEKTKPITLEKLRYRLGVSDDEINKWVNESNDLFWLNHRQNKWLLSSVQWQTILGYVNDFIKDYHNKNPYDSGVQKEQIRQSLQCEEVFLDIILKNMLENSLINKKGELWFDPSFKIVLNQDENLQQEKILKFLDNEGFSSSDVLQLSNNIKIDPEKIRHLIKISEREGKILRLDNKLLFTKANFLKLKTKVRLHFENNLEMTVPEFKELANTTRKYAVPLLEYFDKLKITYRDGNARKLYQ
tara:strand:- start:351 stop:2225 length:1875 start_codon:yes stop_codon:yes gene_type:complete